MTLDWSDLDTELATWHRDGLTLPLWWRDDDTIEPTTALDQLVRLSDKVGVPVHLAVIPAFAQPALVDVVDGDTLIPVVHGWSHHNHAPEGQKKAEFADHRPLAAMTEDICDGRDRLTSLFGDKLRPMFVPPWNRIEPAVIAGLPALGFTCLSTFKPRTHPNAAAGLQQINTHLDPIDWRADKSLIAPETLIAQVARQLAERRQGMADNAEPYGILTHHLVHDAAIWEFTQHLITRLMQGPARAWTAPKQGSPTHEPT